MPLADQLRTIKIFLRNAFAHETLDEAPVPSAPAEPGRQFAAMLLGREPLALDAELPAREGAGPLGKLFAPEELPEDPVEPRREARPGLLGLLFAPESLPEVPAPPARPPRSAWLRWLFRFERLDPP